MSFILISKMRILILFLTIGIANSSSTPKYLGELPKHTRPISYSITIKTGIADNDAQFEGQVEIELKLFNETSEFLLHMKDLLINEQDTVLVDENSHQHRPRGHIVEEEAETMGILFNQTFQPGIYKLKLTYHGTLREDSSGFFKTSYFVNEDVERFLAATHFEAHYARYTFPCWDTPEYRAIFNITLIYGRDYQAISNMPMKKETLEGYAKITEFQPTPPMPAYLVAFVVSDFANVTNEFNNFTVWAPERFLSRATFSRDIGMKLLRALEDYTGIPYALPKIDFIPIPKMERSAMENWGLVTYQYPSPLYGEELNKTAEQYDSALAVSHELAHQWFGNLVGIEQWKLVWLKEGFAEFLQYYILDKVEPTWETMKYFVCTNIQLVAFKMDGIGATSMNDVPPIIRTQLLSDIPYRKAASVIYMMKCVLTDRVFQQGLRFYLKENAYQVANPDILFESLEKAVTENSDIFDDDFHFKKYMDPWVNQAGFPMIQVDTDVINNTVTITQERFLTKKPTESENHTDPQWYIPLNFATRDKPNFNDTMATIWLKPNEKLELKVDLNNTWIIFNLQQSGYYRVNYDEKNWRLIIDQLNNGDHTVIHEVNRAQLIADCIHMVLAGKINPSLLYGLLNYLNKEKSHAPWLAVISNFNDWIATEDYDSQAAGTFLAPKLEAFMQFLKYEPQIDDDHMTKLVRPHALRWACGMGAPSCHEFVTRKLNTWLENPSNRSIPIDLWEAVLCSALLQGDVLLRMKVAGQIQNPLLPYDRATMQGIYEKCLGV